MSKKEYYFFKAIEFAKNPTTLAVNWAINQNEPATGLIASSNNLSELPINNNNDLLSVVKNTDVSLPEDSLGQLKKLGIYFALGSIVLLTIPFDVAIALIALPIGALADLFDYLKAKASMIDRKYISPEALRVVLCLSIASIEQMKETLSEAEQNNTLVTTIKMLFLASIFVLSLPLQIAFSPILLIPTAVHDFYQVIKNCVSVITEYICSDPKNLGIDYLSLSETGENDPSTHELNVHNS